MKKLHYLLVAACAMLVNSLSAQIHTAAPYCQPTLDAGGSTIFDRITNVTLGTINNNTNTTGAGTDYYTFYNDLTAPSLAAGSSYPLHVSIGWFDEEMDVLTVYADFNHDEIFEASEMVYSTNAMADMGSVTGTTATYTASMLVPASATGGITRMRVIFTDSFDTAPFSAPGCFTNTTFGEWDYGEIEDYNINITTGTCDTVTGLAFSAITGASAHIAWTAVTGTEGYQYIVNATAAAPTAPGTATTANSANVTGLLPGHSYYAHVLDSCGAGSLSAWVNKPFTTSLGVSSLSTANTLRLKGFPNPAGDDLTIQIEGEMGINPHLQITDITGKQVAYIIPRSNTTAFDMKGLSPGTYLVRYADDAQVQVIMVSKR